MRKSIPNSTLLLNKGRGQESERVGQRTLPNSDELTEVTLLAEHLGWNYNAVLTGIYFKRRADIWQAVLKAEMARGPSVAYFTNTSLLALTETVHHYASKGIISWFPDKRPVRVSKRRGVRRSYTRS